MNALDNDTELTIYQAFLRLAPDLFPAAPFQLNPWTEINDDRWLALIRAEVAVAVAYLEGRIDRPHPRQRTGALLTVLRQLKPLLRKPSEAAQTAQQYAIGERVTVKGLEGTGPVYRDAGAIVWVCLGNTATPHDRKDVERTSPSSGSTVVQRDRKEVEVKAETVPLVANHSQQITVPAKKKKRLPSWYKPLPHDPTLSGAKLWRVTGENYYRQLRDRFVAFLEAEPHAPPALKSQRQHMVEHLDRLHQQLQHAGEL